MHLCTSQAQTDTDVELKSKGRRRVRGQNAATLTVAGTCGGFSVHGLKKGALIHPKQANHVAGVGVQPGESQTERSSRQSEVLALCEILQVRYLNDKAVKFPTCGGPGGSEAVPCIVRDGEARHHGLRLLS